MKKLLILFISLFISFNSFGEWSFVAKGKIDEFYVDFDKLSKKGGNVYFWQLTNFPSPPYHKGKSEVILLEVNCNPPIKQRERAIYWYESPMGQGSPITNEGIANRLTNIGPWEYDIPGSIGEELSRVVCLQM